jgi:hypothetical protein
MKLTRIATPLIAVAMMTLPTLAQAQSSTQRNAVRINLKNDQPYRDGLMAARLDAAAKRPIDPTQSYLYVHPPVKEEARDAYRTAFAIGYKTEVAERPRISAGD